METDPMTVAPNPTSAGDPPNYAQLTQERIAMLENQVAHVWTRLTELGDMRVFSGQVGGLRVARDRLKRFVAVVIICILFYVIFCTNEWVLESRKELGLLRGDLDVLRRETNALSQKLHALGEAASEFRGLREVREELGEMEELRSNVRKDLVIFSFCLVFFAVFI